MPSKWTLRQPVGLALKLAAALSFLAPLATRLVIGQAFVATGRGKLEHFQRTVDFFSSLGIPLPELNAAFVSRLEFYGGILLILGLGTRLVASGLVGSMVVALMTADREAVLGALRGTSDAGLLGWLVLQGPGLASLDRLLFGRLAGEGNTSRPPAAGAA
jgi:putative oxidoreductase